MGWLRALNTEINLCGVWMTNPLDNQGQIGSGLGSSRCRAPQKNFFLRGWNNQRNSKIYSCLTLSSTNLFHIAFDNTHQLLTVLARTPWDITLKLSLSGFSFHLAFPFQCFSMVDLLLHHGMTESTQHKEESLWSGDDKSFRQPGADWCWPGVI